MAWRVCRTGASLACDQLQFHLLAGVLAVSEWRQGLLQPQSFVRRDSPKHLKPLVRFNDVQQVSQGEANKGAERQTAEVEACSCTTRGQSAVSHPLHEEVRE